MHVLLAVLPQQDSEYVYKEVSTRYRRNHRRNRLVYTVTIVSSVFFGIWAMWISSHRGLVASCSSPVATLFAVGAALLCASALLALCMHGYSVAAFSRFVFMGVSGEMAGYSVFAGDADAEQGFDGSGESSSAVGGVRGVGVVASYLEDEREREQQYTPGSHIPMGMVSSDGKGVGHSASSSSSSGAPHSLGAAPSGGPLLWLSALFFGPGAHSPAQSAYDRALGQFSAAGLAVGGVLAAEDRGFEALFDDAGEADGGKADADVIVASHPLSDTLSMTFCSAAYLFVCIVASDLCFAFALWATFARGASNCQETSPAFARMLLHFSVAYTAQLLAHAGMLALLLAEGAWLARMYLVERVRARHAAMREHLHSLGS